MLNLFRRHLRSCPHKNKGRKHHKCPCPISVEGWLGDQFIRRSLGIRSWDIAQATVRDIEASLLFPEQQKPEPPLTTIKIAIEKFLSEQKALARAEATIAKHRVLLERQLIPFSEKKGIQYIDDFTLDLLREFRTTWKDAPLAASKKTERIKSFFKFAVDSGYISSSPAIQLKSPKVKPNERRPFELEEFEKMIWACDIYNAHGAYGEGNRARLRAFILVLRYTGLRIRDVVMLKRSSVRNEKIYVRTQKTGTPVLVPVPPTVLESLDKVPIVSTEYYFWTGQGLPKSCVADWQRSLRKLFSLAGIEKASAHRFRTTMAVELLKKGTPVDSVAAILGNTSRIVEKHYAPWIASRQVLLEEAVRRTW